MQPLAMDSFPKTDHPVKIYLRENKLSPEEFGAQIGIHKKSIYRNFNGKPMSRKVRESVEISTQGAVTSVAIVGWEEQFNRPSITENIGSQSQPA